MLQKLVIRNYAIIDSISIEPDGHLNTVTGETGAGKSIILGALSLILGERADTTVLINKQEKCVVEAHFDVENNHAFSAALKAEELDEEKHCIIRREISVAGKSRAFINDTPVNLNTLHQLTALLVDLHQQFDNFDLEDDHFQMEVVDVLAKNKESVNAYQDVFSRYKKISRQLADLINQRSQWQKEADYKQFLYDELSQAAFKEQEIEEADSQLKQFSHSEKIIQALNTVRGALDEGDVPIINELKKLSQLLQGIADITPGVNALQERLLSVNAELKDIASELESMESKVTIDPEQMQLLEDRISVGYKLFKKHGLTSTDELLVLQGALEKELEATLNLNDAIEALTKEQQVFFTELSSQATAISEKRKKTIPLIADQVNNLLVLVGMPNARFQIGIAEREELVADGKDKVSFLLDANKSNQFQLLHKAASGGELSRIMLCIKSLTAKAMELPTLIFDEVDTGISGEAARQVGILLQSLSKYHQVICITHQPQVAAKGSRHFFVYKEGQEGERITTQIRVLQKEERILAIARMIGGEKPSEAALQNAKELTL